MLDRAGGRTATGALRDLLRLEQVRLIYEQLLLSQLVAVLNAVVFVAVQSLVIAAPVLIAWLAAVCVLALIRIAGGIAFRSNHGVHALSCANDGIHWARVDTQRAADARLFIYDGHQWGLGQGLRHGGILRRWLPAGMIVADICGRRAQ